MTDVWQVEVALDAPVQDSFTYALGDESADCPVGACVEVPFGRRKQWGFVVAKTCAPPPEEFKLRKVLQVRDDVLLPASLLQLSRWAAGYLNVFLVNFYVA